MSWGQCHCVPPLLLPHGSRAELRVAPLLFWGFISCGVFWGCWQGPTEPCPGVGTEGQRSGASLVPGCFPVGISWLGSCVCLHPAAGGRSHL